MCVIASLSRHARHARTTRAKQNGLTLFGKKHGRQQLWRMPERKSGLDFWKRLGSVVDTSDLAGVALAKGRCTRWKRGHVRATGTRGAIFRCLCVWVRDNDRVIRLTVSVYVFTSCAGMYFCIRLPLIATRRFLRIPFGFLTHIAIALTSRWD